MDFLNGLVAFLNFVVVPATAYGAQLALGALGATLVYGILRFSNFAQGDTMAFGTMVTILFTWLFQSMGISFPADRHCRDGLPSADHRPAGLPLLPQAESRAHHYGHCVAGGDVCDERHHPSGDRRRGTEFR
jgi:branched-chain amino acid transport system permease protein